MMPDLDVAQFLYEYISVLYYSITSVALYFGPTKICYQTDNLWRLIYSPRHDDASDNP